MKTDDTPKRGKIIILSAPSGSGKSTIIQKIMPRKELDLQFSISCTSRAPRGSERNGVEYYFLTHDEFMQRVRQNMFVEWEEVYAGTCYGTLRSEIERITSAGHNVIMDIDVKGALNIKKQFGQEALALFILPPDLETLSHRLHTRATDDEQVIKKRLAKAEYEMSFSDEFDAVVVNDELNAAVAEVSACICRHIRL